MTEPVALEFQTDYHKHHAGDATADKWLDSITESSERRLEFKPKIALPKKHGRDIYSVLIMAYRVFYFVDEAAKVVWIVDFVSTSNQTRLQQYKKPAA